MFNGTLGLGGIGTKKMPTRFELNFIGELDNPENVVDKAQIAFTRRGGVLFNFYCITRIRDIQIYVDDSDAPVLEKLCLHSLVVQTIEKLEVRTVEIVTGTSRYSVNVAKDAITKYLYQGYGLDIDDIETVLEMEKLIDYKAIEKLALVVEA